LFILIVPGLRPDPLQLTTSAALPSTREDSFPSDERVSHYFLTVRDEHDNDEQTRREKTVDHCRPQKSLQRIDTAKLINIPIIVKMTIST
jgi:hypothetical protein